MRNFNFKLKIDIVIYNTELTYVSSVFLIFDRYESF